MDVNGLRLWRCAIVGAAIAGSYCTATAQQPQLSDAANAMIGSWEFSNADHDKICRFAFRTDASAGGYRVDVDRNCSSLFPSTKEVVGWNLDSYGNLRLLDKTGNAVLELTEAETGIFDGFQPGEGRYVLQSAAAAPVHSPEDLLGDWAIARGTGKPICVLTLANNPAGADNLSVIWCWCRQGATLGGSKKTTPTPGCACPRPPIRCCWYGSNDATRPRF
jgi:hypothetical protein